MKKSTYMIPETRLIVLFDKEELMNSNIEGGGNQYDGRAKDNGESFIETEPLPQMKFNMWEEDEEEEWLRDKKATGR